MGWGVGGNENNHMNSSLDYYASFLAYYFKSRNKVGSYFSYSIQKLKVFPSIYLTFSVIKLLKREASKEFKKKKIKAVNYFNQVCASKEMLNA